MAKALLGYVNSDSQNAALLAGENRRLRARISDLEAVVIRLAEENDALIAERTLLADTAADAELSAMQLA
jgi:hypothetical protein